MSAIEPLPPSTSRLHVEGFIETFQGPDGNIRDDVSTRTSEIAFTAGIIDNYFVCANKILVIADESILKEHTIACLPESRMETRSFSDGAVLDEVLVQPPCNMQSEPFTGTHLVSLWQILNLVNPLPEFSVVEEFGEGIRATAVIGGFERHFIFAKDGKLQKFETYQLSEDSGPTSLYSVVQFAAYNTETNFPHAISILVYSNPTVETVIRLSKSSLIKTVEELEGLLSVKAGSQYKDERFNPPVVIDNLKSNTLPSETELLDLAEKALLASKQSDQVVHGSSPFKWIIFGGLIIIGLYAYFKFKR